MPCGTGKFAGCNARSDYLVDLFIDRATAPGTIDGCFVCHVTRMVVHPSVAAFPSLIMTRVLSFWVPPALVRYLTRMGSPDSGGFARYSGLVRLSPAADAAGAAWRANLWFHTARMLAWPVKAVGSRCFGVLCTEGTVDVIFGECRLPELVLHTAGLPWVDRFYLRLHHLDQGDNDC